MELTLLKKYSYPKTIPLIIFTLIPLIPILCLLIFKITSWDYKVSPNLTQYQMDLRISQQLKQIHNPVIGVLTKPLQEYSINCSKSHSEVIEARYVKFLETAGARVVPISYSWPIHKIQHFMRQINGLLFIGGDIELREFNSEGIPIGYTPYAKIGIQMIQYAIQLNNEGVHFPIFGICLGFELLVMGIDEDLNVLKDCGTGGENYNANLVFNSENRMYSNLPPELSGVLSEGNYTFNYHHYCVDEEIFNSHPKLNSFFKIVSLSKLKHMVKELNNEYYISSIEGYEYPFYGVQFHPEKALYHFTPTYHIDHSPISGLLCQNLANFFAEEGRKNNQTFGGYLEECNHLIDNYPPYFEPYCELLYIL